MLWVAPTEHDIQTLLRNQTLLSWRISSLPEQHGCDILVPTKQGICGYQRKTLPDLVASIRDGRLYYELNQLSASATVSFRFLLVESSFATTTDATSYIEADISVGTLRTLVAKFYTFGVGYIPTSTPRDTISAAVSVSQYLSTGRAGTVHRPKQTSNEWGLSTAEGYGTFLLQSFPGIGPKVAKAIYTHFKGVPIAWTVDAAELARVPGIGRRTAERLLASLAPPASLASAASPAAPVAAACPPGP